MLQLSLKKNVLTQLLNKIHVRQRFVLLSMAELDFPMN